MKYLIITCMLLFSGCAVTHTAIIYCPKKTVEKCMEEQVGKVKIIKVLHIGSSTYIVDYE